MDAIPTQAHGSEAPARATRREWIGLAVIALACVLYAMDLTVLFLAAPAISRDLGASSTELLWITDIYGFLVAGLLVTMGTLGDRIGRRRLLLWGAAAFGVASLLAAFSTSPEMLIASRALLGIAGATLAPSTLSLISNMFGDPGQRTFAIGVWATSYSVGAAVGPLVGGLLLDAFWWGSVFLLALPVMGALLVLGPRLLPEFRSPQPGRFDLPSAVLSLVAVLAIVFAIKELATHGADPLALGAAVAGVALAVVFVRRQGRLDDPLIDLRLFRVPSFSAALGANTVGIFVAGGAFLFIAQYMQLVLGLSPFEAGLWTLPSAAAFIAGSMAAPVIVRRLRPALAVAGGLGVTAAGLAMLTQLPAAEGLALLVAASVVIDIGLAVAVTLGTDLIVGAAPPDRSGAASAISETGAELGGAFGIAVLGSIGAAVYRGRMEDAVGAGIEPGAAAAAQDTLAGALESAAALPATVVDSALLAFSAGFELAAGVTAVLVAAAAAAVLLATRTRKAPVTVATPVRASGEPCGEAAAG